MGLPPFGLFVSELHDLRRRLPQGRGTRGSRARVWRSCSSPSAACSARCTAMLYGVRRPGPGREPSTWPVAPVTLALLGLLVLTGLAWPPGPRGDALERVVAVVGPLRWRPARSRRWPQALRGPAAARSRRPATDQVAGRLDAAQIPPLAERLADLGAAAPAPGRRRHARAVRRLHADLRLRAASLPAAGLRARLGDPAAARAFRRWPRARSRPAASSARSTISSASSRAAIRIPAGSPCTSSGRRATIRCAATSCRAGFRRRGPALPVPPRRGRGTLRDHRRARPRRHHRARPLPLQRRGRDDRQPRDAAGLRAQGHREALRDAAVRAHGRARRARLRRRQRRPRARLLPGPGAPGRRRRCRRGPRWLRVVLLELERLYNHVGDVGMIVNDTGFAFGHAHCFRIREELLRLNERVTRPPPAARRDRARRRRRARSPSADLGALAPPSSGSSSSSRRSRACRWPTRWCSSGCRGRGA